MNWFPPALLLDGAALSLIGYAAQADVVTIVGVAALLTAIVAAVDEA